MPVRSAAHKVTLLLYEGDISSVPRRMPRRDQPPSRVLILILLTRLSAAAWTSQISDTPHSKEWILSRIQSINKQEVGENKRKDSVQDAFSKLRSRKSFTTDDLQLMSVMEARELLMEVEDLLVSEKGDFVSDRQGRGLWDMFTSLADIRTDSSTLIRGGNNTGDERGILDFAFEVAGSIIGGVSNKNDGPVLIPNHCW